MPTLICIHPDDRERASAYFDQCVAGTETYLRNSWRIVRPDGSERYVRLICLSAPHGQGPSYRGTLQDVTELREAEDALQSMQTQLTGALRQKERLAQLGGAVAKISHDLRNILTTAQLFADRIEGSADPMVSRAAPKLVSSISRAVSLCESTLAFGKAEEAAPLLRPVNLGELAEEVAEAEGLAEGAGRAAWLTGHGMNSLLGCR